MHVATAVDLTVGFFSVINVLDRLLVRVKELLVACHICIVACFFSKVSLRVVIIVVKSIVCIAVNSQRFKWHVLCFVQVIGVHVF